MKSEPYNPIGSSSTSVLDGSIETIGASYIINDVSRVQRFLQSHAYLLPLLQEVPAHIDLYFPNALLALDVETDPEGGVYPDDLVVRIRTDLSAEAAIAKLKCLDKEWWIDRVADSRGFMTINVEFV